MPSFLSSERPDKSGCAPRIRKSETFPALETPGRENFVAKEREEEEERDAREGDCRNETEEQSRGKLRAKKRDKKRIENWQERV